MIKLAESGASSGDHAHSLDPADRTSRPHLTVAGLPPEWEAYTSDEIEVVDVDAIPPLHA
ncbi:MAG: hypothetical protein ACYDAK_08525 [Candidatus Limnocylindrales bacterium]